MRRTLVTIGLILVWTMTVLITFIAAEKYVTPPFTRGDVSSLESYLTQRFDREYSNKELGSGGFALVHHGKIVTERGFGVANPESGSAVSTDSTLYLLSSLSKAVTAWGIMKLVEEKKIGLDDPVLPRLSRWRFPGSDGYNQKVTVRHLLSHTAGFVDGYGHGGFRSAKEMQTVEAMLEGPTDTNMGGSHAASLVFEPGTAMVYSSAGYGVLQLLTEEITGRPFQTYMREEVLIPLGMTLSSYDLREVMNENRQKFLATQYDIDLRPYPHRYYSNMAGVSLRSSIHELALLACAYTQSRLLSEESKKLFSTPQPGTSGSWGLGHTLYGKANEGEFITGHGGGAFPASGAEMRVNPSTGNGIVIVVSGSQNFISSLGDDWTYWETGHKVFDIRNVVRKYGALAMVLVIAGALAVTFLRWKLRQRQGTVTSA